MNLMSFTSFADAHDFVKRCPHRCWVWDLDEIILVEWRS